MKYLIIISSLILVLTSCKKIVVDDLAFPSEKLDSYEFQNYEHSEITLPNEFQFTTIQQHLISLTSVDEITGEEYEIYGLYMGDTSTIDTDTIIYYGHGQSLHMDNYWTRAALLANLGGQYNYGVFMIDYRGYGMSEGKSSEHGLIEDINSGLDWLISKGASQNRTFYYGYSLGAIPLIDRTAFRSDFQPQKLIIESPLASVENLTHSSTLINVNPDFVTTLNFDNAENMKSVDVPLMWLHGIEDSYIQISNGELIYDNHNGIYKEAHRIETAEHSNIPTIMGESIYLETVLKFIRK